MNFEDLKDPEFQEKLKSAQTPDELIALAKEKGVDLADDQLEAISGGGWSWCSEKGPCTRWFPK